MSDGPDNLVLVYLRRLTEGQARIEADVSDVKRRLGHLEESVAALATAYAGTQLRLDRVENRLDRIERRIDLQDARA